LLQYKGAVAKIGSAGEVELGDFEVAWLGYFEVAGGALDYEDGDIGALEEAGFIGADELVVGGFGEGSAEQQNGGALRGLGVDDEFTRDGGCNEGTVGGAFDLLDGVDGGGGDDGGAVLLDGGDGALDGGGVDERADGVVDEYDVRRRGGWERCEGVGDRVLAGIASGDDMDLGGELVLGEEFGDAGLLCFSNSYVDGGDAGDGEEGTEGVQQDRLALEFEELLGDAPGGMGHAGADTGGGDDDEDRHGNRSITLLEMLDLGLGD
jgi:hypothetical protein